MRLKNRGDTIVEVLIAMSIISMVLGAAYASSRRMLIQTQQTQERSEAIKYAEQQLERLRFSAEQGGSFLFTAAGVGGYCMAADGSRSNACGFGLDGRYNINITRNTVGTQHTFHVHVNWERAGGGGDHFIDMYYRVHPLSASLIHERQPV